MPETLHQPQVNIFQAMHRQPHLWQGQVTDGKSNCLLKLGQLSSGLLTIEDYHDHELL